MTTNRGRLEGLWRDHLPDLVRYARRRCHSHDDALDVVAEVYLVAWRRIDDVPVDARPWLFAVAHHVMANHRRGELRRTRLGERLAAEVSVRAPEVDELAAIAGDAVRAALAKLNDGDRELLTLVAWDGLAPTEAAQVLGLRASTARVRLHRARQRLAVEMKRMGLSGHVEGGRQPAAPRTETSEVI